MIIIVLIIYLDDNFIFVSKYQGICFNLIIALSWSNREFVCLVLLLKLLSLFSSLIFRGRLRRFDWNID